MLTKEPSYEPDAAILPRPVAGWGGFAMGCRLERERIEADKLTSTTRRGRRMEGLGAC